MKTFKSESPRSANNRWNCSEEDIYVEPERPLLDVLPVKIDDILEVQDLAAAAHLPQPRDSRLRVEPAEVVILIAGEISLEKGPRPDK